MACKREISASTGTSTWLPCTGCPSEITSPDSTRIAVPRHRPTARNVRRRIAGRIVIDHHTGLQVRCAVEFAARFIVACVGVRDGRLAVRGLHTDRCPRPAPGVNGRRVRGAEFQYRLGTDQNNRPIFLAEHRVQFFDQPPHTVTTGNALPANIAQHAPSGRNRLGGGQLRLGLNEFSGLGQSLRREDFTSGLAHQAEVAPDGSLPLQSFETLDGGGRVAGRPDRPRPRPGRDRQIAALDRPIRPFRPPCGSAAAEVLPAGHRGPRGKVLFRPLCHFVCHLGHQSFGWQKLEQSSFGQQPAGFLQAAVGAAPLRPPALLVATVETFPLSDHPSRGRWRPLATPYPLFLRP